MYKGVKGAPVGRLPRVQRQWEPHKIRLLSLKKTMQKKEMAVKHSHWRGLRKGLREVRGGNRLGGIQRRHETLREGEG